LINLTIQASGKTKEDLIIGCDGVISRIIEGEEYAKAEAPDGSGKYSFQLHGDAEPFIFGTHKDVQAMSNSLRKQEEIIKLLEKQISDKSDEINTLKTEQEKEIAEIKKEVETKVETPSRPSRRLRSY